MPKQPRLTREQWELQSVMDSLVTDETRKKLILNLCSRKEGATEQQIADLLTFTNQVYLWHFLLQMAEAGELQISVDEPLTVPGFAFGGK